MQDELKKYLLDISTAIEHILLFIQHVKGLESYSSNLVIKRAVERELEIIGEALGNAIKMDEALQISNARKIINTRNKIIHGYDEVDDGVIWSILIRHLPILKIEVQKLLNEQE